MITSISSKATAFDVGKHAASLLMDTASIDVSGSASQIIKAIRQHPEWIVYRDPRLEICYETITRNASDETWLSDFRRGFRYAEPRKPWTLSCDELDYLIRVNPYVRMRCIDKSTVADAINGGLSVRDVERRLLNAECRLYECCGRSWEFGWHIAVDAIRWLDSEENQRDEDSELFYGDLRQLAADKVQSIRRECYATSLATGTPSLDEELFLNWCGRKACLEAGVMFDDGLTNSELADVLSTTTDIFELREIAAQQKAIDAHAAAYSTWTPFGFASDDLLRRLAQ